jgi:hypothetical protein
VLWAVTRSTNVPAGSFLSFTGRGCRERLPDSSMVSKCRLLTDTVIFRHLTCARPRSRNVSRCRLTQTLADGRTSADRAEMWPCFGLRDASVAAAMAAAIATITTATVPQRVTRLN